MGALPPRGCLQLWNRSTHSDATLLSPEHTEGTHIHLITRDRDTEGGQKEGEAEEPRSLVAAATSGPTVLVDGRRGQRNERL